MLHVKRNGNVVTVASGDLDLFDIETSYATNPDLWELSVLALDSMVAAYNAETVNANNARRDILPMVADVDGRLREIETVRLLKF